MYIYIFNIVSFYFHYDLDNKTSPDARSKTEAGNIDKMIQTGLLINALYQIKSFLHICEFKL